MILAQPVCHPERPGQVLLNAGFMLTEPMIDKLTQLQIGEVWIEFPGTEYIEEHVNPEISRLQQQTGAVLQHGIESIGAGASFEIDYGALHEAIRDLIDEIVMSPNALALMEELSCSDTVLLQHSVNVMLMSLLLGLRLDGYLIQQRSRLSAMNAKKVASLGVGALLHDIGLLRLEPEVLERWSRSGDESDPRWREHVEVGYELVKSNIDPTASNMVLHHHQALDGSGFPAIRRHKNDDLSPMSGEQIHVFCRIMAVANRFDRLRHPVDGSERVPRVRVLGRMLFDESEWCRLDPHVLRALVDVVPPFEVGKMVVLSDGRDAVVLRVNTDDPCNPVVSPLLRGGGGVGEQIDLRYSSGLHIESVEGQDVGDCLFAGVRLCELDERVARAACDRSSASGWSDSSAA
jgi:HD-GYP domain-containing protein (c-di-GMP phosphodiesterase class II)